MATRGTKRPYTPDASSSSSRVSARSSDDDDDDDALSRTPPRTSSPAPSTSSALTSSASASPAPTVSNASLVAAISELGTIEKQAGNRMKSVAYFKAARSLKAVPFELATYAGDVRAYVATLDGVGKKIAAKVVELLSTGKLQRLEREQANPRTAAIAALSGVHGIGPVKAQELYDTYHIHSLDDLRARPDLLNAQQQIGLSLIDDLHLKIPRAEMDLLVEFLQEQARVVDPNLILTVCGSYRRGAPQSGDIDVLLTTANWRSTQPRPSCMGKFVEHLHRVRFLTHDLGSGDKKYMGVCVLPPAYRERLYENNAAAVDGSTSTSSSSSLSSSSSSLSVSSSSSSSSSSSIVGTPVKQRKLGPIQRQQQQQQQQQHDTTSATALPLASPAAAAAAAPPPAPLPSPSPASTPTKPPAPSPAAKGLLRFFAVAESSKTKPASPQASPGVVVAAAASIANTDSTHPAHHRRIDIRFIPMDNFYCGVLYFTGSDAFNQRMRGLALERNLTLNEYELCRIDPESRAKGEALPVHSERDVFDAIGMDWLEPHQR